MQHEVIGNSCCKLAPGSGTSRRRQPLTITTTTSQCSSSWTSKLTSGGAPLSGAVLRCPASCCLPAPLKSGRRPQPRRRRCQEHWCHRHRQRPGPAQPPPAHMATQRGTVGSCQVENKWAPAGGSNQALRRRFRRLSAGGCSRGHKGAGAGSSTVLSAVQVPSAPPPHAGATALTLKPTAPAFNINPTAAVTERWQHPPPACLHGLLV